MERTLEEILANNRILLVVDSTTIVPALASADGKLDDFSRRSLKILKRLFNDDDISIKFTNVENEQLLNTLWIATIDIHDVDVDEPFYKRFDVEDYCLHQLESKKYDAIFNVSRDGELVLLARVRDMSFTAVTPYVADETAMLAYYQVKDHLASMLNDAYLEQMLNVKEES